MLPLCCAAPQEDQSLTLANDSAAATYQKNRQSYIPSPGWCQGCIFAAKRSSRPQKFQKFGLYYLFVLILRFVSRPLVRHERPLPSEAVGLHRPLHLHHQQERKALLESRQGELKKNCCRCSRISQFTTKL